MHYNTKKSRQATTIFGSWFPPYFWQGNVLWPANIAFGVSTQIEESYIPPPLLYKQDTVYFVKNLIKVILILTCYFLVNDGYTVIQLQK